MALFLCAYGFCFWYFAEAFDASMEFDFTLSDWRGPGALIMVLSIAFGWTSIHAQTRCFGATGLIVWCLTLPIWAGTIGLSLLFIQLTLGAMPPAILQHAIAAIIFAAATGAVTAYIEECH